MTKTKQKRTPRIEDGAFFTSITGRRLPIRLVDSESSLIIRQMDKIKVLSEHRDALLEAAKDAIGERNS